MCLPMVQDIMGSNPIRDAKFDLLVAFLILNYILTLKERFMNKKELNALLNEASRLLDEIEVTIDNMFYAAYKSQNQLKHVR